MDLTMIGAGFGRTGTLSLKRALETLGFGPCYHMAETVRFPAHDALWLASAGGDTSALQKVLAGYRATVDWPAAYFWKQLMAANPRAKVILSLRDPDGWYRSADQTIFRRMRDFAKALADGKDGAPDPAAIEHRRMVDTIITQNTFDGDFSRDHAIRIYNAHNEEVRRSVPEEQLLIYEPGDGWDPLCAFLGAQVPQEPYPRVNSTADFNNQFPGRY